MFMLYAIVIGLVLGLILGGRVSHVSKLRLEWLWVAFVAVVVQTVLFTPPVWTALGSLVAPIYVVSMSAVLVVVVRNLRRARGLGLVALGTASNLAAIIANGGYMPVTAEALGLAEPTSTYYGGNSVLTADPQLALLVDRFALPAWLPLSTVFSVGDVLIGVGLVIVLVGAMRGTGEPDGDPSGPDFEPEPGSTRAASAP